MAERKSRYLPDPCFLCAKAIPRLDMGDHWRSGYRPYCIQRGTLAVSVRERYECHVTGQGSNVHRQSS